MQVGLWDRLRDKLKRSPANKKFNAAQKRIFAHAVLNQRYYFNHDLSFLSP